MAMPAGYKPSPLGYGSPRSSPFRRPESPSSPSLRHITPTGSPTKGTPGGRGTAVGTPASRFGGNVTPSSTNGTWTPRNQTTPLQPAAEINGSGIGGGSLGSGARFSPSTVAAPRPAAVASSMAIAQGSALSQLQQSQVRTLREAFQILDRDGDGTVGREDVADMLNQLGLPSTPSDVSQFFPPASPQTINMGTFLNSLASALAAMSPSTELLSALSAFDEDDSGQIDLAELRDTLLHTAPEPGEHALTEAEINRVMQGFTGRRAFSTKSKPGFGSKRGEVFKYHDFVQSIAGGSQGNDAEAKAEATAES